ncbi:MAG: hypothetical protein E3J71_00480 [Candidatus Stahlbacteria bacterium]|nr:MAG: hypothetical protein E3J71_00480 [Candidatus Stahlbacteria bacterium]
MPKKGSSLAPICQAIVVCDQVIREAETNKLSLMGLFNSIKVSAFPTRHTRMHVYVSLTNYIGETKGMLKFLDPEGNVLAQIQEPVVFQDKFATIELNFVINGMVFPKPGVYTIEFLVSHQLVGSRKIEITRKEK